jgi:hypothetical protein
VLVKIDFGIPGFQGEPTTSFDGIGEYWEAKGFVRLHDALKAQNFLTSGWLMDDPFVFIGKCSKVPVR